MTCSGSCSSRAAPLAAALALLSLATACAGPSSATRAPDPADAARIGTAGAGASDGRHRIALFPVENLSGTSAPQKQLRADLEAALRARGVDVVAAETVDAFLLAHRIRYTGGLRKEDAKSAGEDLGVTGVLVAAVELFGDDRVSMTGRLISADDDAAVVWTGTASKVANDAPGLLGLGILRSQQEVKNVVVDRLTRSLVAHLKNGGPALPACTGARAFAPRVHYRSSREGGAPGRSVIVLPFRNRTGNRAAGERLSLEFVRQLASTRQLSVIEPGVLRDLLLRFRIIIQGGVAFDDVRNILGALDADLIVTGTVFEYVEGRGSPSINFTAMLIDARTEEVVWSSASYNRGNDRVVLFDLGDIPTANGLACRMVRGVVDGMLKTVGSGPAPTSGR